MTKLEIGIPANGTPSPSTEVEARPPPVVGTHLRCPTCGWEVDHPQCPTFDFVVKCPSCKTVAEFRQWHEAWCAHRRSILVGRFPELKSVASGNAEIDTKTGGAKDERLQEP